MPAFTLKSFLAACSFAVAFGQGIEVLENKFYTVASPCTSESPCQISLSTNSLPSGVGSVPIVLGYGTETFTANFIRAFDDINVLSSKDVVLPTEISSAQVLSVITISGTDLATPVVVGRVIPALTESTGCRFTIEDGSDSLSAPQVVQPITLGQNIVEEVAANGWSFFLWTVTDQFRYLSDSFKIRIVTPGSSQIMGVFVKYTPFDEAPECPSPQCGILKSSFPEMLGPGCDFTARSLSCSVSRDDPCVNEPEENQRNEYVIRSKQTRNGRYVIGIQGQGKVPANNAGSLGYKGDGFENPVAVTFKIDIE